MRAPTQIPVRTKFFLGISNTGGGGALSSAALRVAPGQSVKDVMTVAEFNAATQGLSIVVGRVYRDLGRQITVVDSANRRIIVWRCVQEQLDASAEGASLSTTDIYVRVWAADGAYVDVARLG